ncbi:heat shock 70 kDa protein 12B-like [Ruditapes philippinarum]|uniref:heat shock 70 kDa protein 12B-like n=1 Tax=Ruditapes philippinarum TaxID=129788 RepID=UPI00295B70D7|nr:heat shock 70 kDa protein 12B-like [Ruditapes philippinarum]
MECSIIFVVVILLHVRIVQGQDEVCNKDGDCPSDVDNSVLVAAFDFGTTYSGYAFSFRDKPMDIQASQDWTYGYRVPSKTATSVLLTPSKEFHSFGFEAEDKYLGLTEEDTHKGWLLFRRFKMILHNKKDLSRKTTVKDINGVSMPAMTIFAMSIRFLRNHLLKRLEKEEPWVKESDIKYILTVPAIWKENAKQFMREAAVEAGIKSSNLKLALEPEAASIWCQIATDEARTMLSKAGTQYMVIDLGGGTGDISVHEKQIDGSLKEIHKPSGGSFGGTQVDDNFLQWLTKLFGKSTMEKFKEEEMEAYFNLLRNFELKKRQMRPDVSGKITFNAGLYSLLEFYKRNSDMSIEEKIATLGLKHKLKLYPDKLRVDASIIREWFESPIRKMMSHVKDILAEQKMKNVKTILLVGGFGESDIVYEAMKTNFENTHTVIRPHEASLAVLKGAVRFGHIPDIIKYRIMTATYGISVMNCFDKGKHPVSKKIMLNNKAKVDNIFHILFAKTKLLN